MSKGNTFENDLLLLIFNGVAIADIAENDATGPLTNLFVALHTADPGEAGTQATSEVVYTSYARVGVLRTGAGWVVTANSVSPAANVDFPAATGGAATATHASIGTLASGAGKILYKGALSSSIGITTGVIPRVAAGSTITED